MAAESQPAGKFLVSGRISSDFQETGKSDAIHNIQKDLNAGFDCVFSIALTGNIKDRIESTARRAGLSGEEVKFFSIGEFFA